MALFDQKEMDEQFDVLKKKMDFYSSSNNVSLRSIIHNRFTLLMLDYMGKVTSETEDSSDFGSVIEAGKKVKDVRDKMDTLLSVVSDWAKKPRQILYTDLHRWAYTRCAIVEILNKSDNSVKYGTGFICSIVSGKKSMVLHIIAGGEIVKNTARDDIYIRFRNSDRFVKRPSQCFSVLSVQNMPKGKEFECSDLSLISAVVPAETVAYENMDDLFEPHSLPIRRTPFTQGIKVFSISANDAVGLELYEGSVESIDSTLRIDSGDTARYVSASNGEAAEGGIYKHVIKLGFDGETIPVSGPVFDSFGQVIAFVVFSETGKKKLCYAMPASDILAFIDKYNETAQYKIELT